MAGTLHDMPMLEAKFKKKNQLVIFEKHFVSN